MDQVRSHYLLLATPSNFKKHLQTVHKTTTTLVEKDPCKDGGDCSKKQKRDWEDVGKPSQQKQQCTIANKSIISATKIRGLISEYVIEDVLPLSTVESPAFRKLIGGMTSAHYI